MLADRGYDTNGVLEISHSKRMEAVILPKRKRKNQREYNQDIYEKRYQVENAFLKLKSWRGIATRYTKRPHHIQQQYKSVACISGFVSFDDTI